MKLKKPRKEAETKDVTVEIKDEEEQVMVKQEGVVSSKSVSAKEEKSKTEVLSKVVAKGGKKSVSGKKRKREDEGEIEEKGACSVLLLV